MYKNPCEKFSGEISFSILRIPTTIFNSVAYPVLYSPGEELGSGAFGMVVQATAYGIDKPGVPQQVAVKMLKGQSVIYLSCDWKTDCYSSNSRSLRDI